MEFFYLFDITEPLSFFNFFELKLYSGLNKYEVAKAFFIF